MKFRSLFLLALAAVLALAVPRRVQALEVSFSFFQDSLAPYGEWLEVGDYGYCWRPTGVDGDWAPYADGYWAYTDGGWTWVSYEDFGGIVYHYGRWVRVEDEGWCWVPDYEWAPAWVSWRNNDDYVGWAPLPPEARWERNRGFSVWVDYSYDIAPSCYNFVRVVDFGAPVLRPLLCNRRENVVFIQNTVNVTNITYNTGAACVFNGGPDFVRINRYASRPVPALKLVQNTNVTVVNNTIINNNVRVKNVNPVQRGNQLVVVAPNVIRPETAQVTALVKPNVRRTIPQARVTKGWGAMPANERTAIRTKFKQETKDLTPETAPARPMKVADVQVVPKQADPDAPSPAAIRKDRPRPGAPNRDHGIAGREPAAVPSTEKPAEVERPANPRDAAKIAREKVSRQKSTPEPQPAEVATSPAPAAPERVKPARPDLVKPFNPVTANEQPPTTKTPDASEVPPKRTAAKQIAEDRERAAAAARERAAEQQQAARQREAAQQAQEVARERAAAHERQEAVRQRQMNEQAQEAARQRSADAAQDRQRMIQQQQQEQNAARARAAEQQETMRQRQAAQQAQEIARERNAQAAAAQRQRAMESHQQQQAAQARAAQMNEARQRAAEQQQANSARQQAAERAQMQHAARAQAAQQQQAQAAAREQAIARSQAQAAMRQQAAPPPPRQAPPQRQSGRRQLTPEEAAALKQRQR